MDNELLKKVLTENQRIIIPALGVFLRKEQCGTLIFNPFLKKDDGKLSAIVELEYGVSSDEAKEIIEQYTDKVRTILKAKSKYYIDGLGALVVDNNGVISFSPQTAPTPEPRVETRQTPSQPVVPQPISRPAEVNVQGNQPFNQSQASFRAQYSQPSASIPQPVAQPRPAQPAAQQPFMQSSSMSPSASPFSRPAPMPKPTVPGQPIVRQPAPRPAEQPNATQITPPTTPHIPAATQPQGASRKQTQKNVKRAPRAAKNSTKKGDMWLVIAIAAAAIVIVLMVIGIINSSQLAELSLQ